MQSYYNYEASKSSIVIIHIKPSVIAIILKVLLAILVKVFGLCCALPLGSQWYWLNLGPQESF